MTPNSEAYFKTERHSPRHEGQTSTHQTQEEHFSIMGEPEVHALMRGQEQNQHMD